MNRLALSLSKLDAILFRNFHLVSCALVFANLLLALFVIKYIPYTEIDWTAYMQQVSTIVNNGERDYLLIKGGTGPLVYPAGHVYVYTLLYFLTDNGRDIRVAQYIFALLHCVSIFIILHIYKKCHRANAASLQKHFPLLIIFYLLLSRRAMSLFVLRLFNDAVQLPLIYASILALVLQNSALACIFLSAATSVKMNALLYLPGFLLLLVQALGPLRAISHILCYFLLPQLVLALPFLTVAPKHYFARAFELTRVFFYKWSVNGAFLEEHIFLSRKLAVALLTAHLVTLLYFGHFKWTRHSTGLAGVLGVRLRMRTLHVQLDRKLWTFRTRETQLDAMHVVAVLLTSNFIGIVFARTLHYQFYVWYVHTLPLLTWISHLPLLLKLVLPVVVEVVFNCYPPRAFPALALLVAHAALLAALIKRPRHARIYRERAEQRASGKGI